METIHEMIEAYLENQDQSVFSKILEAVKTEDKLWSILARPTNNFYMGIENEKPAAYLFTKKEYADEFAREVRWEGVEAKSLSIGREQRAAFFSDIFRSGFEAVAIDKGQDFLVFSLFNIIEKPELKKNSEIVMNQTLMRAAIQFYQELSRKRAVKEMQDLMCNEIYKAKLLIPVDASGLEDTELEGEDSRLLKKNAKLKYPTLAAANGQKYYPVFTDWIEFGKFDKKNKYHAVRIGFYDLKRFARKESGAALNPFGFNLILDKEKVLSIEGTAKKDDKIIKL